MKKILFPIMMLFLALPNLNAETVLAEKQKHQWKNQIYIMGSVGRVFKENYSAYENTENGTRDKRVNINISFPAYQGGIGYTRRREVVDNFFLGLGFGLEPAFCKDNIDNSKYSLQPYDLVLTSIANSINILFSIAFSFLDDYLLSVKTSIYAALFGLDLSVGLDYRFDESVSIGLHGHYFRSHSGSNINYLCGGLMISKWL